MKNEEIEKIRTVIEKWKPHFEYYGFGGGIGNSPLSGFLCLAKNAFMENGVSQDLIVTIKKDEETTMKIFAIESFTVDYDKLTEIVEGPVLSAIPVLKKPFYEVSDNACRELRDFLSGFLKDCERFVRESVNRRKEIQMRERIERLDALIVAADECSKKGREIEAEREFLEMFPSAKELKGMGKFPDFLEFKEAFRPYFAKLESVGTYDILRGIHELYEVCLEEMKVGKKIARWRVSSYIDNEERETKIIKTVMESRGFGFELRNREVKSYSREINWSIDSWKVVYHDAVITWD